MKIGMGLISPESRVKLHIKLRIYYHPEIPGRNIGCDLQSLAADAFLRLFLYSEDEGLARVMIWDKERKVQTREEAIKRDTNHHLLE